MKSNQKGFAHLLALILVLVVIGVIGFVGWSVYSKSKPNNSGSPISKLFNKSDASKSGLMKGNVLECLPRGHDNYRTGETLAVDPKNANTLYVGVEYKGVYKSTDAGATWKEADKGIAGYAKESDPSARCIQELGKTIIDPNDSNHVIISRVESPGDLQTMFSETAGVWETTNGGQDWHQLVKDGMNASGSDAIAFAPNDTKTIYYGSNNMPPSFSDPNHKPKKQYFNNIGILYKTTNGGRNWAELPTGAEHGFRAFGVDINPKDPNGIWLFTLTASSENGGMDESLQKGAMKSTDGGKTWTSYAAKFPKNYKTLLMGAMNPTDFNNVFVSTQGTQGEPKSFTTNDGGQTWTATSKYMEFATFDTTDKSGNRLLGYNGYDNGGGIYQSTDKGHTWSLLSKVPAGVNNSDRLGVKIENFAFAGNNTVYMSGSGANVWKSTDNGKTWTKVMSIDTIGGPNKNKDGSTKSREQDPGVRS